MLTNVLLSKNPWPVKMATPEEEARYSAKTSERLGNIPQLKSKARIPSSDEIQEAIQRELDSHRDLLETASCGFNQRRLEALPGLQG